jgi:hypothetical protein
LTPYQGHVTPVEVRDDAVEVIGDKRASDASLPLLRKPGPVAEHEVVDEQLRATVEELRQGLRALPHVEDVLLLDRNPGQLLAHPGDLVASVSVPLLGVEQLAARRQPFLAGPGYVL